MAKPKTSDRPDRVRHRKSIKAKKQSRAKLKYGERGWARWTSEDLRYLVNHWGVSSTGAIATHLGRTCDSLAQKARSLGLGIARRGTLNLAEIAKKSGWSRPTILKACEFLGIKPMRAIAATKKRRGTIFSFTEEEYEQIVTHLRERKDWTRYNRKTGVISLCARCHRERKISCKSLCHTCLLVSEREARQWGVGRCAPYCLECGGTRFSPFTCTRCWECHRAHARAYMAKRKDPQKVAE